MIDVTALGELLIDFTYLSTDETGYPTMAAHPGGAPANFLAALAGFGAKTALLGKVGADAFGKLLVKTLEQAGIETRGLVQSSGVFTTLAFVTLDESGDREFSFARKPGADTRLTFDELDLGLIDGAREVKLFGETIEVRARIESLKGISGHADLDGLLNWLEGFKKTPKRVFVVHGEDTVTEEFARTVEEKFGCPAFAPFPGGEADLIADEILSEGVRIPVKTKKPVQKKADAATDIFTRSWRTE